MPETAQAPFLQETFYYRPCPATGRREGGIFALKIDSESMDLICCDMEPREACRGWGEMITHLAYGR
jgi:hypothetical protein